MDTELSIVIPCLNEGKTLDRVLRKAKDSLSKLEIDAEIIVADNGSSDRSVQIATDLGVRVVHQQKKGYGSALKKGIEEARGKFIIMGDADDTYDFSNIEPFVCKLNEGADLVMGSRFKGRIRPKAMPFLHRYVGNPVLTAILNIFFHGRISDAHCGLRAFRKGAIDKMDLRSDGMEFASEMLIKALCHKLKIEEVPIEYHPSLPDRVPHLHSFRDGWRHLRFMLIFSPRYMFILPGLLLLIFGFAGLAVLAFRFIFIFNLQLGLSAMIFFHTSIFIGTQLLLFGISAKIMGYNQGLMPEDGTIRFVKRYFKLETGLVLGALIFGAGCILGAVTLYYLFKQQYSPIVNVNLTKLAIVSATILLLGIQVIASSFYLSLLDIKTTLK